MIKAQLRRLVYRLPRGGGGALEGMRVVGPLVPYAAGTYEPDVAAALGRLVRTGDTCADVGAYVGYFTLLLARLVGAEGRVIAFEASPANARVVRENISRNALDGRVTVVEAAVVEGDADDVALYGARTGTDAEWTVSASFAAREDERPRTRRAEVRARGVALDAYFGTDRLDLVKMDIEGAEARAIAGMRRLLHDQRPIVVLEFHGDEGWPAIEELLAAGYRLETAGGETLASPAAAADVPYHVVARPPER